jgi:hypothetical protein
MVPMFFEKRQFFDGVEDGEVERGITRRFALRPILTK